MDMEESAEESQAAESGYEEELVPKIITDEVFDEVTTRGQMIIKDLQVSKQYLISEDVQKLLLVCQNLKQNLLDEKDKIEQMKSEVTSAAQRVSHAVKMSKADQEVIQQLKSEIDEAWRQKDAAQSREQIAQEAMNVLREKLEKLQKEVEKYSDRSEPEEGGTGVLSKQKDNVRERDRLINEIEELTKKVQTQTKVLDELEEKNIEDEEKIKDLYRQMEEVSNDAFKGKRSLEHAQVKLEEVTEEKNSLTEELKSYKQQFEAEHKIVVQQNMQMLGLRANLDKHSTQNNLNNMKLSRLTADLDNLVQVRDKLNNDLNTKNNILKLKEDENAKFRLENAKILKSREILMKKLMTVEASKTALENDIIKLKNIISTFEKEREQTKRNIEQVKKYSDGLVRDRDLVRKDLVKCNKSMTDQKNQNAVLEQQLKTIEVEIKKHVIVQQRLQNSIAKLEKEKEEVSEEKKILIEKAEEATEEINSRNYHINDLKEKLMDSQAKLLKTQHELQSAQADIINLEKDLQTCMESKDELREKIKDTSSQIEKLNEQIITKDEELKRSQKHTEKIEKEKQGLKVEIQSSLIALQHTKSELHEIKAENIKLIKTLRENDVSIEKLKKQLDALISEKELITSQITKKVDDINLLNQKINMMQLALDRSNSQYNDRLEDIKMLKIEVNNLRSQRNLLTRGISSTADMRQEVLQLNRVLVQERVRAKALENEMNTPMNIHRWRKLSGIDPDKMELLGKVHTLQKRLLCQTSILMKKDETIQTFTQKVQSLEEVTTKLPSQDVKEELMMTRHKLSAHTKKMKAAIAVARMKEDDLKTKDFSINDLKTSLLDVKKQLVKEKKDKNRLIEKLREMERFNLMNVPRSAGNEYRIYGSGFKVKNLC